MKKLLVLCLYLITPLAYAQKNIIDSLEHILSRAKTDSQKVNIMEELAYENLYINPQKTIDYCSKIQEISQKIGDKKKECFIINLMGGGYWSKGNLDEALLCFQKSLQLSHQIGDDLMVAKNTGNIGLIYSGAGYKELAKINYQKALFMYRKLNNEKKIASSTLNIGVMLLETHNHDSARYYFEKATPLYEKLLQNDLQTLYINWTDLFFRQNRLDSAVFFLQKAQRHAQKQDDLQVLAYSYFLGAEIELQQNKQQSALLKAQKALQIAQQSQSKETIYKAYKVLSKIWFLKKDYKQAYQNYHLFQHYKDSVESELAKNALQLFEHERKNGEVSQLKAQQLEQEMIYNQEKAKKNIILLIAIGVAFSLLGIITIILRSRKKLAHAYKQITLAHAEIQQKNEEVEVQAEELQSTNNALQLAYAQVQESNKNIIDSINYAKRIQEAILPFSYRFDNVFGEQNYFIFYQPRNIVSGDFYFLESIYKNDQVINILVVADCTGHGVPGAFMSMIGNQILTETVIKNYIFEAHEILNHLDKDIIRTLKQNESKSRDGMDISVCCIYKQTNKLEKIQYAGAVNPMYYIQKGNINVLKANKKSIGGSRNNDFSYQKQELILDQKTEIYLFSDGYQDQFGGEKNKKFMVGNFKKLLVQISEKPMTQQGEILEKTIRDWISAANEKQTDDITVLGIRINL